MNGSKFNGEVNRPRRQTAKNSGLIAGSLLIFAGLFVIGRNLGFIDNHLFRIIISWPMILVVVGLMQFAKRDYTAGVIITGTGAFFLLPRIMGAGPGWFSTYLPLLLIFIGVMIIAKVLVPAKRSKRHYDYSEPTRRASGFIEVDSVLGNYENIVLDEVFTGADVRGVMGGTVLDLRHTTIPEGDTYIDVNTTMSGLVLHVPAQWEVVCNLKPVLGGVSDKRYGRGTEILRDRRLVLRGNVTLGGVEIKN